MSSSSSPIPKKGVEIVQMSSSSSPIPKKGVEIVQMSSSSSPIPKKGVEIVQMSSSSSPIPKKGVEIVEMSGSSPIPKKGLEIVEMSSSSPVPKKGLEIVQMSSSSSPIPKKGVEIVEISGSSPIPKKGLEIVEMSSSSPIPKKGVEIVEKSSSSAVKKEAGLFEFSSEEDSEEDKKHIRRSPVYITTFNDYIKLVPGSKVKKKEPEQESDEELLRDRYEVDHGYKYVLRKRWKAVTNLINPERTYFKSGIDSGPTKHVLHDPEFPIATFSKLAIKTYNDIQGTEYEYVGLVKAYMRFIGGWHFWIRFKACVVGQDAINFQANIYQDFPNRETNVVPVRVEFVHPLPPCCQINCLLT